MKTIILSLFVLVFFSACNAESTSTQNVSQTGSSTLEQQNACSTFNPNMIAKALSWAGDVSSESMGHKDGKRSLCRFGHGSENLWVRLGWKSGNAVANKVLEQQFRTYLANGENGISYESLAGDSELVGTKPSEGGQPKLYVYRIRYGNEAELMFELYSDVVDKSQALGAFQSLVGEL